jgi:group I intron endonuclease
MKNSGIYKIQSKCKPERCYIGSAINIRGRWNDHKRRLRIGKHINPKLQNHYNKYGLDDLVFEPLVTCDKEELIDKEQFFIDAYTPWFNICPRAGSNIGHKCSDEKKQLLRERNMGHECSAETRRKISETKLSAKIKLSEEQKRSISARNKGMIVSRERREKTSKTLMGHPVSEESRQKMRDAKLRAKLRRQAA